MRTEVNITRNFKEENQLYFYAQGGVHRAIVELIYKSDPVIAQKRKEQKTEEATPVEAEWRYDGTPYPVAFQGGEAEVRVVSESGRISLNRAAEPLLRKVMKYFVEVGEQRDMVVDSIFDWKDPDDFHRINGAENDYYRSLSEPYDCKNGDFDSVEELLLVRGMTPELLYGKKGEDQEAPVIGFKDVFTVFSTTDRVDLNAAPPEVLTALLGIPFQLAKAITDARGEGGFSSPNDLLQRVPEAGPFLDEVKAFVYFQPVSPFRSVASYYTITSWGKMKTGEARRGVECVVKVGRGEKGGYKLIAWKDVIF
jgi:general secretion pathway protein K